MLIRHFSFYPTWSKEPTMVITQCILGQKLEKAGNVCLEALSHEGQDPSFSPFTDDVILTRFTLHVSMCRITISMMVSAIIEANVNLSSLKNK